ncbi:intermembrane transport protein PqiB [Wielerella bovis]|uniref:intermembrane transport protein PqiB n=1 Tax=Wielerella bovis TaxID=2917790 RepID=UPI002019A2C0|nr:intermembrane transport protein PqiB [Wielerella bovis]MCG7657442.1 intermembrane transport protein PqiB [Wielerella bovis]MCG7659663.1 intermembrane transport protein PqiB [Wielerella bovis]
MTTSNEPQTAKIRPSKTLVSTVWLIPLAAAIVGGYLLVKNIRSQGPEITLYMDNADGIEVNTTTIRVLNVEVGRVVKVRLRPDKSGVEIIAKLNRDSAEFMRKDTQFWVVKPRIDQNGITGLGTLLSGSYIAFNPGSSSEEAHEFTVSELPPITALGQTGVRFTLTGKNSKMISAGSPVLYENYTVGTVESAKFNPADQSVQYSIFVQSPHENLVKANSRFWLDNGIDVRLDGGGIKVNSAPLSALLSGAISFDTPNIAANDPTLTVQSGATFTIHNDRAEIENQPNERTLYYVAFFNNSVRGLDVGAPVEYKGIRIGSVANVPYFQGNDSQKLFQNGYIPVRLRIDPDRIEQGGSPQSKEYWQNTIQAALNKGLSATISSNNLVLGSKLIALEEASDNSPTLKPQHDYGGDIVIATRGGGLDDLQAQVSKLLDKFNALPLDKTVGELNGSLKELQTTLKSAQTMLASANKLVGQNSTQNLPRELNKTLTELRQTLQGISPQSPMYQDVQATLQSIDRTLQNAQPVLNTLKEQPNALIFNRSGKDPIPKGK